MKLLVFFAGCLIAVLLAVLMLGRGAGSFQGLAFQAAHAGGVASSVSDVESAKLGVYYFPGWRDRTPHAPADEPWERIKPYPEREPAVGWYDEGDISVMQSQVKTMAANGLSFIVFDWYWGTNDQVYLEHALQAFRQVPDRRGMQFSILWANHDGAPASLSNFDHMVAHWINHYFSDPDFLRVGSKPVVIVFSAQEFDKQARLLGMEPAALMMRANDQAQAAGLPGIYFVAGTTSDEANFQRFASVDSGYSAVSAYNLHWLPGASHASHSFAELDAAYRTHWERYDTLGQLPVIYPMSSGWNKRPWGGSDDPRHDDSVATPDEFEQHIRAGVAAIRQSAGPSLGVICCWNEYGEGSYIEPTRQMGSAVLRRLGRVLSPEEKP